MKKDRSIFFPLALIAAGTLWILVSMGRIPAENLWALAHFWPFLLIAAGIGLILRSYWAPARALVDVLVVGGAVLSIVFAAQLGWNTPQWGMGLDNNSFGGGVRGSGKLVTETREVQDFTSISIAVPAEVTIQQGSIEKLEIKAEDNLMAQISSDTNAGKLVIKNSRLNWNDRVSPTQPVVINITVKDLNSLELSSAGKVVINALETETLVIRISGTGDLNIKQLSAGKLDCMLSGAGSISSSGSAEALQLTISGVGSFTGGDLLSKSVMARISGAGSATVHPSDELNAEISGTGSISYYGSPNVSQRISGLGSVNKIGE